MVIMVILFLVLVFGRPREAMKFTNTTPGHCLSPDHVQLSTTAVSELHCSTSCIRDGQCQGFCFKPTDSSCLITHTEQATVLEGLQVSAGAANYFIELKSGFVRKGKSGYLMVRTALTHYEARQACWNLGTRMNHIKNEEETQYIKELAMGHYVWSLSDDIDQEGTWQNTDTDEVLTYLPWYGNEPNGGTSENCALDRTDHTPTLIDISCTNRYYYICQDQLL